LRCIEVTAAQAGSGMVFPNAYLILHCRCSIQVHETQCAVIYNGTALDAIFAATLIT
jgi:hypothetical protein